MTPLPTEVELKALYGQYIECSLRYYHYDESVIADEDFDHMCVVLAANWRRFKHRYKSLTRVGDLKAGTGFKITPRQVPHIDWLIRKYPGQLLSTVFPSRT